MRRPEWRFKRSAFGADEDEDSWGAATLGSAEDVLLTVLELDESVDC